MSLKKNLIIIIIFFFFFFCDILVEMLLESCDSWNGVLFRQ